MVFDYMIKVKWARPSPADDHVDESEIFVERFDEEKSENIDDFGVLLKLLRLRLTILILLLSLIHCNTNLVDNGFQTTKSQKYVNLSRSVHSSRFCVDLNSEFHVRIPNAITFISEYLSQTCKVLKILPRCAR